jgi:hypothetical protein
MIEPAHDLAITKQSRALNISRGSVYYLPRPVFLYATLNGCGINHRI